MPDTFYINSGCSGASVAGPNYPVDIGGASDNGRQGWGFSYFFLLDEELFGTPESSKTQGSQALQVDQIKFLLLIFIQIAMRPLWEAKYEC